MRAIEARPVPQFPDRDHILLPGDPKSLRTHEAMQRNAAFVKNVLPPWLASNKDAKGLVNASTGVIAAALHSIDLHYGDHGSDSPGDVYLKNPLGENSFPTFYHGGDGTRLAILGSIDYMNYINHVEGESSPYRNEQTYLGVLITAAFDDSIFGYGRGEDERRSANLAANTMRDWPYRFPKEMIKDVRESIFDSTFDEKTLTHAGGDDGAISRASLIGDLWIVGLAEATAHAIRLGVENIYKSDTAAHYGEILKIKAREKNFVGKNLGEFLTFIDQDPELVRVFGEYMLRNATFVETHQFPDPRVDSLLIGRKENATFQRFLGTKLINNEMTVTEANKLAVAYGYPEGTNVRPGTPVTDNDRLHPPHTRIVGRHLNSPVALPRVT